MIPTFFCSLSQVVEMRLSPIQMVPLTKWAASSPWRWAATTTTPTSPVPLTMLLWPQGTRRVPRLCGCCVSPTGRGWVHWRRLGKQMESAGHGKLSVLCIFLNLVTFLFCAVHIFRFKLCLSGFIFATCGIYLHRIVSVICWCTSPQFSQYWSEEPVIISNENYNSNSTSAAIQWSLATWVGAVVTVEGLVSLWEAVRQWHLQETDGSRWHEWELLSVMPVLLFVSVVAPHLRLRVFLFQIPPMCRFCPAVICQGRGKGLIFNVWATATLSKSHMLHHTRYHSYEAHKSSYIDVTAYICRS